MPTDDEDGNVRHDQEPDKRPDPKSDQGLDEKPSYEFPVLDADEAKYVGKRILVGITYQTHEGRFLRQEQFHGLIKAVDRMRGILVERDDTGDSMVLPPQVEEAARGEYRLRSTGEVVVDPDYLAKWVWNEPPPKDGGEPCC